MKQSSSYVRTRLVRSAAIPLLTACCWNVVLRATAQGGAPLWTNRFPGGSPTAITTGTNGNVFVTGSSYTTIAYSPAGSLLWTNSYINNPNVNSDFGSALAVDPSGNVFVTGGSADLSFFAPADDYATIAFSGVGSPLWTNRYHDNVLGVSEDGGPVAISGNGNVVVTGSTATLAYSKTGVALWTNAWPTAWPLGYPVGMAMDGAGKVFVAGVLSSAPHYGLVGYSAAGAPLWTNTGPAGVPRAIALDSKGNVFVTGQPATIAYSNSGVPLWTNNFLNIANDSASAIALDASGHVFVTGSSSNKSGYYQFATVAYSNGGLALWTNRYNGSGGTNNYASAIGVDTSGNVFVGGTSFHNGSGVGYATVGYLGSGVPLWTNRFSGLPQTTSRFALAVDPGGNVLVTGHSLDNGIDNYVTVKYSSSVVQATYLAFQTLDSRLVLSWTNSLFNLQFAPSVSGPFTNVPLASSPYTNSRSGLEGFFRLSAP